MLASGSEISAPYILSVLISLFRYNVLRSGANHTKCDGSRGTNEVSPTVRPNASQILSPPRLGEERTRSGGDTSIDTEQYLIAKGKWMLASGRHI